MSLRFYRFVLPLVRPLELPGGIRLQERRGFLVRQGEGEETRWSEASPLPGFSRESDLDVLADFSQWRSDPDREPTCPSVRFARAALAEPPGPVDCEVSALLHGTPDYILARAAEAGATGCPAAKLKVGARPAVEDADLALEVAGLLGDTPLRLDVNRRWDIKQAMAFHAAAPDLAFEYIEEPLSDPDGLAELERRTGWTVALDESLQPSGEMMVSDIAVRRRFVDKPTLTGGVWVRPYLGEAPRITLSAAFESGVGLYHLAAWATRRPGNPAGLDTAAWLAEDVLTEGLAMRDWRLRYDRMPPVDVDRLEEIDP